MRFGTVAILGRSNVGKSTLLNAVLGEPLASVSPTPQTTRDTLLGVVHREQAQIAFLDTPGIHVARSELGRRMNAFAMEALTGADVVLFMTTLPGLPSRSRSKAPETPTVHQADQTLLAGLPEKTPALLVVNKVDLVSDKSRLLPLIDQYTKLKPFAAVLLTSLLSDDDVEKVLEEICKVLPEGPAGYAEDTLTDRPVRFFVAEYIREQVLLSAGQEVPHAVAVVVDELQAGANTTRIRATIHVEKVGQRKILVGRGGAQIKHIGTSARIRIEQLLDCRVHLELFVRVTPRWRHEARRLSELGYEASGSIDGFSAKLGTTT